MILAMDIGNTNVKIGVFEDDVLKHSWRVSTVTNRTADEFGVVLDGLFATSGVKMSDIDDIVMSSVAPALNYTIEHMCRYYFDKSPLIVSHDIDLGITLKYDNPRELGADRITTAAAAYHYHGGPVILIDFGTATTFNLITKDGEYLGGAIAPGIKTAIDSLASATAKLPRVELAKPDHIVGTNTKNCMQSGIVYGYTGLVKYMVEKYKALDSMKGAKVIATGGLSSLVVGIEPTLIDVIDRALALKGLNYLYNRNKRD